MVVPLIRGENPDSVTILVQPSSKMLYQLKHGMQTSYDYEMLPWESPESLLLFPKTWRKSRCLVWWMLVRSFSKILCTWVDFLLHEPPEGVFIFVRSKDTHSGTLWMNRLQLFRKPTHLLLWYPKVTGQICVLTENMPQRGPAWLCSGYYDLLRIIKCTPMGSDFLHL